MNITSTLFFLFFFLKFCRGPLIPLFWTSGDVCPGFQSQGGFPHLHASSPVHNRFLRFTSDATPAFSTNRGVHCISLYMAWLARLLSHAPGFEPSTQWWAAQRCMIKSDALPTELFHRNVFKSISRCLLSGSGWKLEIMQVGSWSNYILHRYCKFKHSKLVGITCIDQNHIVIMYSTKVIIQMIYKWSTLLLLAR